jgi:two-component system OmpR family response regulator
MPVTALAGRHGRHQATIEPLLTRTRPPEALTVTLNIPLDGETLPPQAKRLLEAVCELVEAGQGLVEVGHAPIGTGHGVPGAGPGTVQVVATPPTGPLAGTVARPGVEVRLLLGSRQVLVAGELMPLTRLEFDLLQFLADHPRRVFSRTQLLTAVWGYEHTGERTVDVHVRRLRVKMADVPLITTVYGVGYRLADDACIVLDPQG